LHIHPNMINTIIVQKALQILQNSSVAKKEIFG
jgi:hypothetical protein